MLRVEGRREGRICYVWLRIIHWRFYGRTSYKEAVTLKIFFVKVQHKVSAVSLPVLLPWFLCSIHSFTFECPKAAALLVRSLWSRGMLCWVWHAIISLTCTYFSSGISNVSRASFSLVAGPHKNLFQDKRRFLKLFPWMVGLRGTGRDGKGKNLVFRHTNKMIASLFFFNFFYLLLAVVTPGNTSGSCLHLTQRLMWEPEKPFPLCPLKEQSLVTCLLRLSIDLL